MTSSTTSTTFTCLTCDQPVLPANPHTCTIRPPHLPKTVTDAIYNCKVCNPTDFTFYRCSCDMGTPRRTVTFIPPLNLPLAPIPEENTDDFTAIFKFDDDGFVAPNSPEHATNLDQEEPATNSSQDERSTNLRQSGTLAPLVSINPNDLPGDLVSRYQAIDKIFRDATGKK